MTAISDLSGLHALRARRSTLRHSPVRSALRIAALTALVGAVFVVLQTPFRHWEALAVADTVSAVGFHGIVAVESSQILLSPRGSGALFWVDITPSCSSLGPALALALIAAVMSAGSPVSDRVLAGIVGVASILIGNLLRIGSSVIVGLLEGRVSLVLFHDWVGSTFGFAYTLGGFVLILAVLLHRRRRRLERS
jgi:exosortase/archaeosortase family protein